MSTDEVSTERLAELRPARRGGLRVLHFDNDRSERYESIFVRHPGGEWDRILIARDDGTIADALVEAINGVRVGDDGLRAAMEQGVLLPEPEGDGWDDEVRMTKRDLHDLLNRHAVSRVNTALSALAAQPAPPALDREDFCMSPEIHDHWMSGHRECGCDA